MNYAFPEDSYYITFAILIFATSVPCFTNINVFYLMSLVMSYSEFSLSGRISSFLPTHWQNSYFFISTSTFFCFPVILGLPTAGKPPPLNMVSPVAKIQRTTATVPPMNQVSPSSSITSVNSNNAMSATRASSFAAALRKLAKQAGDPPGKKQGLFLTFSQHQIYLLWNVTRVYENWVSFVMCTYNYWPPTKLREVNTFTGLCVCSRVGRWVGISVTRSLLRVG